MGALAAGLVAAFAAMSGLYSWVFPLPPIGRDYANGVYRSSECGSIILRGGVATFDGVSVPYNLERGKDDIVAVPPHFLGVRTGSAGCTITYDLSKFAFYLSLGRAAPPTAITLWDLERGRTFSFERDTGGRSLR